MSHHPLAQIVNAFSRAFPLQPYIEPFRAIKGDIPGWSTPAHLAFFCHAVSQLPAGARVLVCGVYHGLDLVLLHHAARLTGKQIFLTGVDLFADAPCADWTPEMRAKGSWAANGIHHPPSLEAARAHAPFAEIVQADSITYLGAAPGRYDLVYLDTSHDEQTVRREIEAALVGALAPRGLLAGDDYCEPGTHWGVDRAVQDLLPEHLVFFSRIWLAQP